MAKYMERRYVHKSGHEDPHRLWEAIRGRDLLALLQAFAEGQDLAKPLVSPEGQVSALLSLPGSRRGMPPLGAHALGLPLGAGVALGR